MLIVPVSVGVLAGLLIVHLRLHLGLPGHKAIFWMTPVLLARLLGDCRAGATVGALAASLTTIGLGGHLAGGAIMLPLVGLAGTLLDVVVGFIEKRKLSIPLTIALISLAAACANLICLTKRLAAPIGASPKYLLGISGLGYDLICYAFFGMLAGFIAASIAYAVRSRKGKSPPNANSSAAHK